MVPPTVSALPRACGRWPNADPSIEVTVFHVAPLPDLTTPAAAGAPMPNPLLPDTYAQAQADGPSR